MYFEDAHEGDVLEIHIEKITCAPSGCALCVPGEGVIGHLVKEPRTKIYDISDNKVKISEKIQLPINPMIGVIGIAPKDSKPLAMYPGNHGGNMDARLIKEGATLYLPVQVEGGLLSMGDLHAVQGDGESFYTGLEVAGEVEITVNVIKNLKIDIPFVNCEGKFASIATAETTDEALTIAMEKLVKFFCDNDDMDFYDAGFLCGLYANLEISQVVDPLKTARMAIDEEIVNPILKKILKKY
ncbi:acetamidase/formamidase family protein [Inconstantimicrobium porci]|uniref:acetamidase/formamidase family protein n=1 Tax=Inconstantimicrobium porci TaxID=2652291 RepID=UPI0024096766|nr:acetamidase/formamidase family protein [Inconstantimicrobium porci]MDD6769343.1 acetamidase/formamidase family protein [Inconstantimicrobium porci]